MDGNTSRMLQVAKAKAQLELAHQAMQQQQQQLDGLQLRTNANRGKLRLRSAVFMGVGRASVGDDSTALDSIGLSEVQTDTESEEEDAAHQALRLRFGAATDSRQQPKQAAFRNTNAATPSAKVLDVAAQAPSVKSDPAVISWPAVAPSG